MTVLPKGNAFANRDSIVMDNLPMAKSAARWASRLLPPWIEFDDIYQSAVVGLIDAANRFKPDCGTPFTAFARKRVFGAAIDPFRRASYRGYRHTHLGDVPPLCWPSTENRLAVRDARELLTLLLWDLPSRERRLIFGRYYQGVPLKDLAGLFHISPGYASKLHAHAIDGLRRALSRRLHIAVRGAGVMYRLLLPSE
jgi:RNA polymerase sigma factor (sigma-70 family)